VSDGVHVLFHFNNVQYMLVGEWSWYPNCSSCVATKS